MAIHAHAEDKTLNLYSWADYVPPATLQRFERETGIHVRYDTFDTCEVLETGMDVVEVAPAYDHAQVTSLAAATLAMEMLCLYAAKHKVDL